MKYLGWKCFRCGILRYGGQVVFAKIDSAEISRIKNLGSGRYDAVTLRVSPGFAHCFRASMLPCNCQCANAAPLFMQINLWYNITQ